MSLFTFIMEDDVIIVNDKLWCKFNESSKRTTCRYSLSSWWMMLTLSIVGYVLGSVKQVRGQHVAISVHHDWQFSHCQEKSRGETNTRLSIGSTFKRGIRGNKLLCMTIGYFLSCDPPHDPPQTHLLSVNMPWGSCLVLHLPFPAMRVYTV